MKNYFYTIIILSLLYSCSTSNDVVHNGLFQKRKYNKGTHFSMRRKVHKDKVLLADKEEVKNSVIKGADSVVNYTFTASKKAEFAKGKEILIVSNSKQEDVVKQVVSVEDEQQFKQVIAKQMELLSKIQQRVSENSSSQATGLNDMLWLGVFAFLMSYLMIFILPFAAVPVFVFSGLILIFSLNDLLFFSNKTAPLLIDDEKKSVSTIFLLGALIALLGFSIFANGMFVMGFTALMASPAQIGLWVALFGIGLVLFAYAAYGNKVNRELRKKKTQVIEEKAEEDKKEQKEEAIEEIDLLKLEKESKKFTWLTLVVPFFIFKAWSLNIKTLKKAKEEGVTKVGAILRLVLLPILAIIGLTIWLSLIG